VADLAHGLSPWKTNGAAVVSGAHCAAFFRDGHGGNPPNGAQMLFAEEGPHRLDRHQHDTLAERTTVPEREAAACAAFPERFDLGIGCFYASRIARQYHR